MAVTKEVYLVAVPEGVGITETACRLTYPKVTVDYTFETPKREIVVGWTDFTISGVYASNLIREGKIEIIVELICELSDGSESPVYFSCHGHPDAPMVIGLIGDRFWKKVKTIQLVQWRDATGTKGIIENKKLDLNLALAVRETGETVLPELYIQGEMDGVSSGYQTQVQVGEMVRDIIALVLAMYMISFAFALVRLVRR